MLCFINNDMDKITENVWLGNIEAAENIGNLKKEGITKVLCLIDINEPTYAEEDKLNQKIFGISDIPTQNIIKYFGKCFDFIKGNEKILVHCMAGASRSATVVIAYVMWSQKVSFDDAYKMVREKRSCVFPNGGFIDQLKMFEKLLTENDYDLNKIDFDNIKWEVKLSDYWK